MSTALTNYLRTTAALVTVVALSAAPASAQRRNDGGGRHEGGNQSERGRSAPRAEGRGPDRQAQPRADNRGGRENRAQDNRRDGGWNGRQNDRRDDRRVAPRYVPRYDGRRDGRDYRVAPYRDVRPRGIVPQYRGGYGYGYRSDARRSYVVPFGYRPYGYRPGWSLGFYFGRPYVGGGYTDQAYGYYDLAPGLVYGSLRIVDAPRDAQVFVDGYYAGVVDDYDGVFQHLNLEPGSHHIELQIDPDSEPIAFDVRIEPGQTTTFHAREYY